MRALTRWLFWGSSLPSSGSASSRIKSLPDPNTSSWIHWLILQRAVPAWTRPQRHLGSPISLFSLVQSLSRVRLFAIPLTAACQASLSVTNSQNLLKLISIKLVMPSNHLILCCPLLLRPSIYIYKYIINIHKMKVTQSCQTLWSRGQYSPWNSRGQNTGVCSLSLLQGVFPTQGLNPGLLHCRQILYQLSNQGNQRIPEWVAYPFCCGSSQPRNELGSPALHVDSLPSELSIYLSMGFPHSSVG